MMQYMTDIHLSSSQKVTADDAKALLVEAIAENLDIEHACPIRDQHIGLLI